MSLLIPNHHPINPDGLVLWLDYKNTGSVAAAGTWKDYSGQGNDGTLVGNAYVDAGGLGLDGTGDIVNCGNLATVDSATELTAWAWVRPTSFADDNTIISQSNGLSNGWFLWQDKVGATSGRTSTFTVALADPSVSSIALEGATNAAVLNTWTHVVFVYKFNDTEGLRLYINGAEDANSPISTVGMPNINSGGQPLRVGYPFFSSKYFTGDIDSVVCITRALSAGEIQTMHQRTLRA